MEMHGETIEVKTVDKCRTVELSFTFERSMASVLYFHTIPKPGNE
jgi:hypothetical protein